MTERPDHWVPTPVGYALCTSCGRECVPSDLANGYCGMGCSNAYAAGQRAAYLACAAEAERRAKACAVAYGDNDMGVARYEDMATWARKAAET